MNSLFRHITLGRVAVTVWLLLGTALVVKNLISPAEHSLYPPYVQTAREFAGTGAAKTCYSVQHLPYFADLLYPFSGLPDWLGSNLWMLASLATMFTGLQAFIARFWPYGEPARARAWMSLVVLLIGLTSLGNNQANILITGCLLWGAVAVHDGRWWLAALCLVLPGFKMYPLALGMLYSALYPRRFGWRFGCSVGAILALPFVFHPAAIVSERYRDVAAYVTSGVHYQTYSFMSVRDFLARWGWPIAPRLFLPVQFLSGAAILAALLVARSRGLSRAAINWHGFLLTSLWFVTFGPSVESQTYLLVAPTVAWLLVESWQRHWGSVAALGLAATVTVIGPLQTSLYGPAIQRAVVGVKVACPILVAIWCRQFVVVFRQSAISDERKIGPALIWSAAIRRSSTKRAKLMR